MIFDLRRMLRFWYKSLFASRGTAARLTPRRLLFVAIFIPFSVIVESVHWLCLLLDEVLFRAYRRVEVREPVFIVGVPRSGTTFLHRLLSRDEERFTYFRLWEIFLAPSIVQKKILLTIGMLDRRLGGHGRRAVLALENRIFGGLAPIHRSSLFESEEDALILIHMSSFLFLIAVYPFEEEMRPFTRFDSDLTPIERARILRFYRACLQRHLYVFGRGRRFLSKNPAFSSALRSLDEAFPDAKLICTIRSPLEVVPSEVSLIAHLIRMFCDPREPYPMRDFIVEFLSHWYRAPFAELESRPPERWALLKYREIVEEPHRTIPALYDRFGFEPSGGYREVLARESERARRYRSAHGYDLETMGLDRRRILEELGDVFEKFGFDAGEPETARGRRPPAASGGPIAEAAGENRS